MATTPGEIERANPDRTEALVTKDKNDDLVETDYLLRSPVNAQRLLSALESAREEPVDRSDTTDNPGPKSP